MTERPDLDEPTRPENAAPPEEPEPRGPDLDAPARQARHEKPRIEPHSGVAHKQGNMAGRPERPGRRLNYMLVALLLAFVAAIALYALL